MTTWTAGEARASWPARPRHERAALWRLALMTGMRQGRTAGAALGGRRPRARAALAVRRTLTRGNDGLRMGEPKTASGRRAIALPASCVAALRRHKARQAARRLARGDGWRDDGLVFDRGDGRAAAPQRRLRDLPAAGRARWGCR